MWTVFLSWNKSIKHIMARPAVPLCHFRQVRNATSLKCFPETPEKVKSTKNRTKKTRNKQDKRLPYLVLFTLSCFKETTTSLPVDLF